MDNTCSGCWRRRFIDGRTYWCIGRVEGSEDLVDGGFLRVEQEAEDVDVEGLVELLCPVSLLISLSRFVCCLELRRSSGLPRWAAPSLGSEDPALPRQCRLRKELRTGRADLGIRGDQFCLSRTDVRSTLK